MDTQYIFGHDGDAMILETIVDAPSDLEGPFSVTVRTSVDEITHSCNVVRKYRSMEGPDGRYYEWYFIDNYFRDTDRTPAIRGDLESAQSAASITFVTLAESGTLDGERAHRAVRRMGLPHRLYRGAAQTPQRQALQMRAGAHLAGELDAGRQREPVERGGRPGGGVARVEPAHRRARRLRGGRQGEPQR